MRPTFTTPFRVFWKRHAMERACRWTRAELERQQAQRLAALRRFASERSPFYRRFHGGLENQPLAGLPILTKAVMMENFDDLVTDRAVRLADAEAFLRGNPDGDLGVMRGRRHFGGVGVCSSSRRPPSDAMTPLAS